MFVVFYTVNLYICVLMTYSTSCCLYDTLWIHGICVCVYPPLCVCVSTTIQVDQVPGFVFIFITQFLFYIDIYITGVYVLIPGQCCMLLN